MKKLKNQSNRLKITVVIFSLMFLGACGSEDNAAKITSIAATCETHLATFVSDVMPILENQCYSCHGVNAFNVSSDLNLANNEFSADFNAINFAEFKAVAVKKNDNNLSWMLSKPLNVNGEHSGGQRFDDTSQEYQIFQDMVSRLATCTDSVVNLDGVIRNTPYEQLRKSTLNLSGRLPTQSEEDTIKEAAGNDAQALQVALDGVADRLMSEDAFYTRLKEIFNDLLLLDAFPTTQMLNRFRLSNFKNNTYFDNKDMLATGLYTKLDNNGKTVDDKNLIYRIRLNANRGIADAPLELIAHVVKNKRPLTEILTANYTLVNPYSATIFGATVSGPNFNPFVYGIGVGDTPPYPKLPDPSDFRKVVITDQKPKDPNGPTIGKTYPHAGILTTLTYLTRYPSTNTNRNRARSRVTYRYFLDLDVLGLGSRAELNLDNIKGTEPTLEDKQCKACHKTIDPLAGLFKNWTNSGQFRGDNTKWFGPTRMLQPGYTKDDLLPPENSGSALQWLASRIINDGRFATSMVKTVFKGLTGQTLPKQTSQDTAFVEGLKTNFINSNYEIRVLVKDILSSIYFTAKNLGLSEVAEDFSELGMGRLLTPEQLHRKIRAVTGGYLWRSPTSAGRNLNDRNTYRILYGGIDSISVTERTTDPTALVNGIQQRIALQTACQSVPMDFNKAIANRALFPSVEITDTPDVAAEQLMIKQNIKHLYKQILGEIYPIGHTEIERAYQLFVSARTAMPAGEIAQGCRGTLGASNPVRLDSDKTVEPWMTVVAFLLSDYKFLYE